MSKLEHRSRVVKLYQGSFEPQLDALLEQMAESQESQSGRRVAEKSDTRRLAREYDELKAEAEKSAVEVTVYALPYFEFAELHDDHPPRDDEPRDKRFGTNMRTMPRVLALVSLADPEIEGLDAKEAAGKAVLKGLGFVSQPHWAKIETAAWDVNTSSDDLPKWSGDLLQAAIDARDSISQKVGASLQGG